MKSDVPRLRHTRAFSAGGVVVRRALPQARSQARSQALAPTGPQPPGQGAASGGVPAVDNQSATQSDARDATDASTNASTNASTGVLPDGFEGTLGAEVEVALVGYPRENTWVLPKGTPALGESPPQTAVREVREETGLEVRIVRQIGSIHYSFTRRGVRFNKEVLHYLMVAVGGDVSLHDHEYDESRWFPLEEALRRLRHKNEADVLLRAEPLIRDWLTGQGASAPDAPPSAPPDGTGKA